MSTFALIALAVVLWFSVIYVAAHRDEHRDRYVWLALAECIGLAGLFGIGRC